ncbi:MAG TPA: DUF2085 domain-containing protein [Pyrinomonadaceae bacterium]|jgi:uncharacterized membrane protein
MPEAIENYTSQFALPRMRRQAWTVWSVSFLVVFVWLFFILLAPLAEVNNFTGISDPIYKFFGYVCHQIPARSFHIAEHQFAVCSRCFGVYFGLFAGFVVYPFFRKIEETEPLPRFWLFLAMVPIGIDWTLGVFGIWENTHFSRFATGMILGAACAIYIIPALVELFRLLASKRRVKTGK